MASIEHSSSSVPEKNVVVDHQEDLQRSSSAVKGDTTMIGTEAVVVTEEDVGSAT